MILGIDLGGSAIKLAALEQGKVLYCKYIANGSTPAEDVVAETVRKEGATPAAVAVTGVGAAVFDVTRLGFATAVQGCLEAEAIAAGTRFLTGKKQSLTASIGTGTAFILDQNGHVTHLGGSAMGGGTLQSLCRKILGRDFGRGLEELCKKGNLRNVDLLMGELPSCPPTLDPAMTAANLLKADSATSPEDWAIGTLNLVLMTVGSMAYLTAGGYGVRNIVFTGGPTAVPEARSLLEPFSTAYGLNFIVPEHSACATAIGCAHLLGVGGAE